VIHISHLAETLFFEHMVVGRVITTEQVPQQERVALAVV
jgi:hypothetical protein